MELLKGKKKKAIFAVIALIALLGVGSTLAWVVWNLDVPNDLTAYKAEIKVEEEGFIQGTKPVGQVRKKVLFKNTGDSSVFLRIAYTEYWDKEEGADKVLLSNMVNNGSVAVKEWSGSGNGDGPDSNLWDLGLDGWYYYKRVLPAGEQTNYVLDSVSFPNKASDGNKWYKDDPYKAYERAVYHLYFRAEVVQASDGSGTLNSEDVNKRATSTIFGRKASVETGGVVNWQDPKQSKSMN